MDGQTIKEMLGDYACVLSDGTNTVTSRERGIRPILEFLESGRDFRGFFAADKVVGKAAAMLLCKCGVAHVFAKTLSRSGKAFLEQHGISCEYETLAERIINRAGTDTCPMEKAVLATDDCEEAYRILRAKVRSF